MKGLTAFPVGDLSDPAFAVRESEVFLQRMKRDDRRWKIKFI